MGHCGSRGLIPELGRHNLAWGEGGLLRDSVKLVRFGQNQLSLRRRPQSRGVGGDAGSKPDTISCHCGERRNPVALVVRHPRRFTVQKIKFVIPSVAEGPAVTSHRASAGKSRSRSYARDDKFRRGQCIGIARVKPTTLDSGSSPLSLRRRSHSGGVGGAPPSLIHRSKNKNLSSRA